MAKKSKKKNEVVKAAKLERGGNRLLKFNGDQIEFLWSATRNFRPAGAGLDVLTHGLALIDELEKHREPKKIKELKEINDEIAELSAEARAGGAGIALKEQWLDEQGLTDSYFPDKGASITIQNRWHEAIVKILLAIRPQLNLAGMKNAMDIAAKIEIRKELEAAIEEAEEKAAEAKDKKK